ncbi:MAG: hypothetical protein RMJ36_06380 [Candidatus Calescibacterium sp.]|nr:hypothetical protein [Candidatus Calescibacterium sp.]MDW8133262.1 hypothetical protein [Candidatus Calescibacterium sp.]
MRSNPAMVMKIEVVVKDKEGNIVFSEYFLVKQKSDILYISSIVSDKIVELERKYPYPEYTVEQYLSWVKDSV